MTLPPRLARACHLCLACLWVLPLLSLFQLRGLPWAYAAIVVALIALTAWRPVAGLLLFSLLLPLAFAVVALTGVPLTVPQVVEGELLAFLAGSALHAFTGRDAGSPSRLAMPAFTLGLVVAVAAITTALDAFGSVGTAGREMWRHVTRDYLFSTGRIVGLHASLNWMEVAALAAVAERTIRSSPTWSPLILASWLGASAATGAQTAVRVVQTSIARGEGLSGVLEIVRHTRVSAVYPDINAAGSLFALLTVTALLFSVARRRWLLAAVIVPVLLMALLATQSRAAIVGAIVVLGAGLVWHLARSGRRAIGIGITLVVLAAALGIVAVRGPAQVSAGAAMSSRLEMWRVALKISREHPIFGVGVGRFQLASRDYLTPAFIASFPEAAVGEHAHNNFLQVLAELGVVGLIAFTWTLWAAFRRGAAPPVAERTALVFGLATFLVSAQFGHPLLIFEIAVAFFLALGLAAGLSPAPARHAPWRAALAVVVIASWPWRISAALAPPPPDVIGATTVAGQLDGQPFRTADSVSRWRLRSHSRAVLFPMRWNATRGQDCRVRILINDRLVDEVALTAETWVPVRVVVPPGGRDSVRPEVELQVSATNCQLLVGPVTAWR